MSSNSDRPPLIIQGRTPLNQGVDSAERHHWDEIDTNTPRSYLVTKLHGDQYHVAPVELNTQTAEVQRRLIEAALIQSDKDRTKTAEMLHMPRSELWRLMRILNLREKYA
jgi:DNA-binding NtrC family response regulator